MNDILITIATYGIIISILAIWYLLFWELVKPSNKNLKQGILDIGLVLICTYLSFELSLEILLMILKIMVN